VAVALRGGDAEGVCPYAIGTGELDRKRSIGWQRGAKTGASALRLSA
jgi:hypothetical protein